MNNSQETIEYDSDKVMTEYIARNSAEVFPSEDSLRTLLGKIGEPVPSPYAPRRSYFLKYQKMLVGAFALVLVISTGAVYLYHASISAVAPAPIAAKTMSMDTTQVASTDISDEALSNDMSNIDTQMNALDADTQDL